MPGDLCRHETDRSEPSLSVFFFPVAVLLGLAPFIGSHLLLLPFIALFMVVLRHPENRCDAADIRLAGIVLPLVICLASCEAFLRAGDWGTLLLPCLGMVLASPFVPGRGRDRYRSVFLSIPLACALVETERGRIQEVNGAFEELTGYPREELEGTSLDLIVRRTPEAVAGHGAPPPLWDSGERWSGRMFLKRKGRKEIPVLVTCSRHGDLWICAVEDMSEREQMEAALERELVSQRLLLDESPVAIQTLDGEGRVVEVNAAWEELLGFSREEAIGRHICDFMDEEAKHLFETCFASALKAGGIHEHELRLRGKNGRTIEMVCRGLVRKDPGGRVMEVRCALLDMTRLKTMEREIQEKEHLYRVLVEQAQDVLYRFEIFPVQKVGYISPSIGQLTGYTPEELYGDTGLIAKVVHPGDLGAFERAIRGERDENSPLRLRLLARDGSVIWTEHRVRTVRDPEGRPVAIEGVAREITARVRVEEAHKRAIRALGVISACNEALVRATSEFDLLTGICRMIVRKGAYDFTWIGLVTREGSRIVPIAFAGEDRGLLSRLRGSSEQRPCAEALESGQTVAIREIEADHEHPEWKDLSLQSGFRSSIAVPLRNGNRRLGVLCIYSARTGLFNRGEVRLLEGLADDIAYAISMLRERDAKERFEKALVESEARFREFAEMLPQIVCEVDSTGRIRFANRQAFEVFGYTQEDMEAGLSFLQMVAPEERERVQRDMGRLLQGEEVRENRYIAIRKDGSRFPVLAFVKPILLSGRVDGFRGVVVDISRMEQMQEALRYSEERYRMIVETANEGIVSMDADMRFNYVNRRFSEIMGYTQEEIVGRHLLEFVHPEDAAKQLERVRERREGLSGSYELRYRHRSGEYRWLHVSVTPNMDVQGNYAGSFAMVTDVTDRKRAEEELVAQGRRLNEIIEHLPDATFAIDKEGRVLAWNRAIEEMTGVRKEEMLGKGDYEYAIPFYGHRRPILIDLIFAPIGEVEKEYRLVVKKGNALMAQTSIPVVKGEKRVLWGKATPFYDAEGKVVGAIESIRDVTEQVALERAIREREELYRSLAETSPGMIYLVDGDGRVNYLNRHAADAFGKAPEELEGRCLGEIFPPEAAARHLAAIRQVLASGSGLHREIQEEFPALGVRWIDVWLTPVRDGRGGTRGVLGISYDITLRKLTEARLKENEEKFRSLFMNADDAIFLLAVGAGGKPEQIVEANPACCPMLGCTLPELLMRPLQEFESPEGSGSLERGLQALADGGHAKFETVLLSKGGRKVPVEVGAHLYALGEERYAICIARDITERKISEEVEREAFSQIEKNIVQLSILNDHIRNPLAVIVGLAGMEEGPVMEKILEQCRTIDRIITELDMAWLESEKIREFMRKHYGVGDEAPPDGEGRTAGRRRSR